MVMPLQRVSLPETLLQPSASIYQDKRALGVTSATAALYEYITSNFSHHRMRVLEAGSGSGILSIMLQRSFPAWDITGLEIQASLHSLAEANATSLNLPVKFVCADLRSYTDADQYDLIISNPPWQKAGHGLVSPNPERAISRTELCCTMPGLLAFCERNLGESKQAVILYPPSRQAELIHEATKSKLNLLNCLAVDSSATIFHLQKG